MRFDTPHQGLALANELVAEGRLTFTFEDAEKRLGKSKTATANLLKRMQTAGLIDRVRVATTRCVNWACSARQPRRKTSRCRSARR